MQNTLNNMLWRLFSSLGSSKTEKASATVHTPGDNFFPSNSTYHAASHIRLRARSVTGYRTRQLPQKSAVKAAQEKGLGFDQELEPNLLGKTEALQDDETTSCNNSKHWLPSKHSAGPPGVLLRYLFKNPFFSQKNKLILSCWMLREQHNLYARLICGMNFIAINILGMWG